MNHHHRKTLHALFAHPISANIDFKKVVHLLEGIGAEVDNKPGNRVCVKLNVLVESECGAVAVG
jgi:hypothetical protein